MLIVVNKKECNKSFKEEYLTKSIAVVDQSWLDYRFSLFSLQVNHTIFGALIFHSKLSKSNDNFLNLVLIWHHTDVGVCSSRCHLDSEVVEHESALIDQFLHLHRLGLLVSKASTDNHG